MTIAVYDPATLDGSVASAKWAMRHRLEEVRPRR
jgi:hypothetical protein